MFPRSARRCSLSVALLLHAGCAPGAEHVSPPTAPAGVTDAAAEPPAAAAGASPAAALTPEEYVRLHDATLATDAPEWDAALERLRAHGDAFTLELLASVDTKPLPAPARERLAAVTADLRRRVPVDSPATVASGLVPRLERAAWADLQCDPLETRLVPWTLESVRRHAADPAVRAALESVKRDYRPAVDVKTMFSTLSARVPEYAAQLLGEADSGS